ncbi:hypothetical protein HBN50_16100 [Halobacteriovorax sp. GB3]|uniref:hypothetical protein n=1 Tax=Halobacteriovorax sp. GB3 TaxID=2719615 RepID=UPI00235F6F98|nr:hypothetical protein [Halobacteriovorax sp. GB3]MDD0854636.1 hypothetical protein [Halobacteriovorax sp. GB3]
MTMISVNNQIIDHKINDKKTVHEIMDYILDNHAGSEEVVTSITINGKELTPEEENTCLDIEFSSFNHINFKLQSSLEMAYMSLDSCSGYIDNVIAQIHTTLKLYNENKIDQANVNFSEVIEIMDLFIQLMARIHKNIKRAHPSYFVDNKTLQSLEIHLLSIMKALVPAKEKNDIIMLSDLLEYELIDNLTQWKIKAIPELKKTREV